MLRQPCAHAKISAAAMPPSRDLGVWRSRALPDCEGTGLQAPGLATSPRRKVPLQRPISAKSGRAEREGAVAVGRGNRARKDAADSADDRRRGLLTVRSALILFMGLLIGGLVAAL